jgi:myosin heavy chain 6/7
VKKKLEADINELEIALDHANKANADAQKNLKKYQEQVRELQMQVEEEQRQRDDVREQYITAEKRCTLLQSEKEEMIVALDQVQRALKQAEYEAHDFREQVNDLSGQNNSLSATKRKLEGEMQAMHADLDETLNELKASEERSKKAMADAARLAEELRQEQEHSMHIERMRKGLEQQIKEMQVRLDEAEAAALKGGKKVIAKLEQRMRELEGELDGEQRRFQDANKTIAKQDRRLRELQFQVDEDKKNVERLQDLIDKLQNKIKTQKRQLEETEELATVNLQKYRQIQHQMEDAEERADVAENSLSKMRAKNRSSASLAPGGGLQTSASAAVMRSPSRTRASSSHVNEY